MTRLSTCLLAFALLLVAISPLSAQDPDPDARVREAIREVEDESRDLADRAQIVISLLTEGRPLALAELRRILASADHSLDLREKIVTAALLDRKLALLSDVLAAVEAAPETEFEARAREAFRLRGSSAVAGLVARALDPETPAGRKGLCVSLLGTIGTREAISHLIDLWAEAGGILAESARKALLAALPVPFGKAEEARAFWEERKGLPLVEIFRRILREQGEGDHPELRRAVAKLAAVLPDASLEHVISEYLLCPSLVELRRMGAERLAVYPYDEREGDEGRKRAAAAILEALGREGETPEVRLALLKTVRALAPTLKEVGGERLVELLAWLLGSADARIPPAVIAALGDLRDPRAVEPLTGRYNQLIRGGNVELRLSILNALLRIGNGVDKWARDKLEGGETDERLVVRLIRLLQKSKDLETVRVLIDLLKDRERAAGIRDEAARTLGIWVSEGNRDAVMALAVHGLKDPDDHVRETSATCLGQASEVGKKVLELLRGIFENGESAESVKAAVARTLLKLENEGAAEYLPRDAEFWKEPLANYLSADLIPRGRTQEAVRLVQALCAAGSYARCVEAARLVLGAGALKWEGETASGRGEISLRLARSLLELEKPDEAGAALADVPESLPSDPDGFERRLLEAGIARLSGEPGKVEAILAPIREAASPGPGVLERANLELARAFLALGRFGEAGELAAPLLEDETWGAEAKRIADEAAAGGKALDARIREMIGDLDATEEAKRAAAIEELRSLLPRARTALLAWFDARAPEALPGAVATVGKILGKSFAYDPEAPEEARKAAVEAVRKALGG